MNNMRIAAFSMYFKNQREAQQGANKLKYSTLGSTIKKQGGIIELSDTAITVEDIDIEIKEIERNCPNCEIYLQSHPYGDHEFSIQAIMDNSGLTINLE